MYLLKRNPDPRQKPPLGSVLDSDHSMSQELVGYWLMNESGRNIYDLTGQNMPGTMYGMNFKPTTGGMSVFNDGTAYNKITIPHSDLITISGDFTITFCVISTDNTPQWQSPISKTNNDSVFYFITEYNELVIELGPNTINWHTGYVFPLNQVVRVTCTYSVQNGTKVYINGVLEAQNINNGILDTNTTPLYIGNDKPWESSEMWEGYIIDVFLWKNKVLTAFQILQLYAEPYANILVPQYWYMVDFGSILSNDVYFSLGQNLNFSDIANSTANIQLDFTTPDSRKYRITVEINKFSISSENRTIYID